MGFFSRRPKFELPGWTFRATNDVHTELVLAMGRWVVTDGAFLTKDALEMGQVTGRRGFLDLAQTQDGLKTLTLGHEAAPTEAGLTRHVLVIDSGQIVFCCADMFAQADVTLTDHRTSGAVTKAARNATGKSGANIVLIHDADEQCIGLVANPMWGDGAYRLESEDAGEFRLLRAHLDESC
ncbi:MAG: hypothetical protein JW818_06240 [Pirellulales bacterium]|nr:hypothetical protein [Pirellulales bacterium]